MNLSFQTPKRKSKGLTDGSYVFNVGNKKSEEKSARILSVAKNEQLLEQQPSVINSQQLCLLLDQKCEGRPTFSDNSSCVLVKRNESKFDDNTTSSKLVNIIHEQSDNATKFPDNLLELSSQRLIDEKENVNFESDSKRSVIGIKSPIRDDSASASVDSKRCHQNESEMKIVSPKFSVKKSRIVNKGFSVSLYKVHRQTVPDAEQLKQNGLWV